MRQQLNENPVVQAVVVGVLLLVGAVFLLTQMGGKGDSSTPAATSTSATVTAADGSTADVSASTDGSSATLSVTATPGATAAPVAAPAARLGPFEAGPGLPQNVFAGYESGKTCLLYTSPSPRDS